MNVSEVMTRDPSCCTPDCRLDDIARLMKERDCGAIPIVGDLASKFPIGIITDRDIVMRALATGRGCELTARDCMTTPAITVTEDEDLDDCVRLLELHQIRRVIVVDREGRCCGIVAQADIASHASKGKVAELVREISKPLPAMGHVVVPH